MWHGRFTQDTSSLVQQFGESVSYDWRLFPHDIAGSIAHARAQQNAGLLTADEFQKIESGLREIEKEILDGKFEFKTSLEDIHMNIEAELTRRIGPAGAKLHAARSRNDQVATDTRLYCRAQIGEIITAATKLQLALLDRAEKFAASMMPGYTHLQRGQPVTAGHHFLAYVEMLERDKSRLADCRKRLNICPLGSGALAGSTINLDRQAIAAELGFDGVTRNSMDAIADRDYIAELLFTISLCGAHLSRLSEDLILWCTAEFSFVQLSDAHTTGSSLMPQKKNPDVCELTRGKTGRLIGNLLNLLTNLKGLPLTYNRDLQEDKPPLFDSVDTLKLVLAVNAEMVAALEINEENAAPPLPIRCCWRPTSPIIWSAKVSLSAKPTNSSARPSRNPSARKLRSMRSISPRSTPPTDPTRRKFSQSNAPSPHAPTPAPPRSPMSARKLPVGKNSSPERPA